jgi:hypothetical protein
VGGVWVAGGVAVAGWECAVVLGGNVMTAVLQSNTTQLSSKMGSETPRQAKVPPVFNHASPNVNVKHRYVHLRVAQSSRRVTMIQDSLPRLAFRVVGSGRRWLWGSPAPPQTPSCSLGKMDPGRWIRKNPGAYIKNSLDRAP